MRTDPPTQLFLCGSHCITVSIMASSAIPDSWCIWQQGVGGYDAVLPLVCSCFSTSVVDAVRYRLALPYAHTSGLQELLSPDEAYMTSAMQGQMYVVPGLALQQAAYAEGAVRQQQPSRPVSPYMPSGIQQQHQQHAGQMLNFGIGGMQPQATHLQMPVNAYGQVQHAMQPAPDRLGITPMQLAMLQQQRLQNRANNLVVTPSIHSVTSSNRSWSDGQ